MSHLIYNVKTLVYVVPFSIIIVVYFSITIYNSEAPSHSGPTNRTSSVGVPSLSFRIT